VNDFNPLPRLVCPQTHQPLSLAEAQLIERLNAAIGMQRVTLNGGELIRTRLDGGYLREDGQVLYPVVHGIPHLTIDQAIDIAQLGAAK
jgi:uncharacterized protein YbaR (Trm112 family)